MSHQADITIIGAGVVGLSIAAQVAKEDREVYMLEKNKTFGQEISSRHSGIIHAGIYYPEGSLKARLCVAGNRLLYKLCQGRSIDCRKLGKLIVATSKKETEELVALLERGNKNGAPGLRMLSSRELKKLEPNIEGLAAILSPETGIIDSHTLMKYFAAKARSDEAQIAYLTEVVGIERVAGGYQVEVKDGEGS